MAEVRAPTCRLQSRFARAPTCRLSNAVSCMMHRIKDESSIVLNAVMMIRLTIRHVTVCVCPGMTCHWT